MRGGEGEGDGSGGVQCYGVLINHLSSSERVPPPPPPA